MAYIKRGDIHWITGNPYRATAGSVQTPGRPGIVVSNDANNKFSKTIEIVYLTSAPKKDIPTHCRINSALEPSTALCEQVTTVSTEQIRQRIGRCTVAEMQEVDRCIAISLGLPDKQTELEEALAKIEELQKESWDIGKENTEAMAVEHQLRQELARAKIREELLRELYRDALAAAR